jgi:nicotinic acid mononucleotide adenylyltransferase
MGAAGANLSKVNAALATGAGRRSDRLAFLVLPGSFSPVHSQHLPALDIAREVMANLGWHVIGGFLAPSDDDYVRRKLGDDSWPFARRLELCRLATDDSPWVDVAPWAEFSSYRVTSRLREAIESDCSEELQRRSAIGVEVMGSDTLLRILKKILQKWESRGSMTAQPSYSERFVCCVVRPGRKSRAEIKQIKAAIQPQAAVIGINVIMCGAEGANPLQEVSSHEIRKAIAMRHWDQLRDSGWLAPLVLRRLQSGQQ